MIVRVLRKPMLKVMGSSGSRSIKQLILKRIKQLNKKKVAFFHVSVFPPIKSEFL